MKKVLSYEEFLNREPIKVSMEEISNNIKDKVILVTGAGGSIGSELCRQIAKSKPEKLILFDIYENNAYSIQQELIRNHPDLDLYTVIGSVSEYDRLEKVFLKFMPHQVYHAAAYKHVPIMEANPNEAVKNNVLGTLNTCKLADKYKIERFVLISTDKAVNPASVMGASKKICEMIVEKFNENSKFTRYVAVRFGNVLGSNGSIIPLFLEQIENGGPVTVTHKDVKRFFITIPEAASLVLQAGCYAKGGEIFVLDMGEQIKIYDIACKLIKDKGLEPNKDIKIKIIGLRPGEKLDEEIISKEEKVQYTPNKHIYAIEPVNVYKEFLEDINTLIEEAYKNEDGIKEKIAKIVTNYKIDKERIGQ